MRASINFILVNIAQPQNLRRKIVLVSSWAKRGNMKVLILVFVSLITASAFANNDVKVPETPDVCFLTCLAVDNQNNLYEGTDFHASKISASCYEEIAFKRAIKNCIKKTEDAELCSVVPDSCK